MLLTCLHFKLRAEIWWKYLDSDDVCAPPPFTFLDICERCISWLRLTIKYRTFLKGKEGETRSTSPQEGGLNQQPMEIQLQINHQMEIQKEFLQKYKQLLHMLLTQLHSQDTVAEACKDPKRNSKTNDDDFFARMEIAAD